MEKENWSGMVNLASINKQVKIIILIFVMLFISIKTNATVNHPWKIRPDKAFKLSITITDILATGRPIFFKTERSPNNDGIWIPDTYGRLTPQGGQFGVIYGNVDSTQLPPTPTTPPTWTGNAIYEYTTPYDKTTDYIRIVCWW